jgi:fibronectin-binding autotransporter adhesin
MVQACYTAMSQLASWARIRHLGRVCVAIAALAAVGPRSMAADVIKADNADALNLDSSWSGGTAPTAADTAIWDSTVTAANTTNLGADLSWGGLEVTNPGGGVTIQFAAGQSLTLGAGGIDMAAATQNASVMRSAVNNTAGTLVLGADQTWNIASGRSLTLFNTSNSANQRLGGSGNITVAGGGVVTMNVGDAGSTSFVAGNGNDTYTGNWTITGGSKVSSLRNGTHAWGQGSITLDNGIMSQQQGNWSYSNDIVAGAGGGTIYSDSSGNSRYLNLTGVISGSGPLAFNAVAAMTGNEGFILTGTNTFTGPMTIEPNGTVRIGGSATTTQNGTGAGTLGSIEPGVAITNNGILGFGWTDAHTVGNAISGTGIVRLGRAGGVAPATQVVTLSGASTYTGATQVNAGRLDLTGSLTSPITVASGAALSGTGSTTGSLTLASGGGIALAGGASTTSFTVDGATFSGSNTVTFLAPAVAGTVYDVFTYGSGTVTTPENLTVSWRGTLEDDGPSQTYIFTAGSTADLTWNTTSGTWQQGVAGNWSGGDGTFYGGDSVTFGEPAAPSTVTLSGMLAPAAVTVNNFSNDYTFSGTAGSSEITGATGLVKNGTGRLVITSTQSYSGPTTVNAGVVDVGNGSTTGSLGSGAISVGAAGELVFNRSNNFTVANTLSGSGIIRKAAAGRMTVSADNSAGSVNWYFSGTGNGDIGFANAAAVGGTGSTITVEPSGAGAAFFGSNGNSTDVAIDIGADGNFTWNGSTGNTTTLSGVISGDGTLTKVSGETVVLTGANTHSGPLAISAGTLRLGGAGVLGGGSFTGAITNNATFAIDTTAAQAISGPISGTGRLIKSNTGTLSLSGANDYTGGTVVQAGILGLGANFTMAGANGFSLVGAAAPVAGTDYGAIGVTSGTLTYGGDLALTLTGTAVEGAVYDLISFSGGTQAGSFASVVLGGDYAATMTNSGGVWTGTSGPLTFSFTEATGQFAVVPEPGTLGLAAAGLALAGWAARRRWA